MSCAAALELNLSTTFVPPQGEALHAFTLAQDSAVSLYSTLSNGATCGNSGFGVLGAEGQEVVSSNHFAACSPTEVRGPWPLKAGAYQLKLWHNASGGSHAVRLVWASSPLSNDAEPNDTPATATPSSVAWNQGTTGHLGYKDAAGTDSIDHHHLHLTQAGALALNFSPEPTLGRGAGVALSGADGTLVRDFSRLAAGDYTIAVWADTYYEGAYGGYTLTPQFTPSPSTPEPVPPNTTGQVQSSNVGLNDRYVVLQSVFTPSASDVGAGGTMNVYFAAQHQGQFYFFVQGNEPTPQVRAHTGGEPPPYSSLPVADLIGRTWTLGLFDVSALVPPGFEVYAGFGRSLADMLTRGQVQLAHQVR
jgi:hypothetical protein